MAETATGSSDSTTSDTTDQSTEELGAGGVKALAEERAARQAADKAAKAAASELEKLRAELKRRDDADLSETEKLRKQVAELEQQHTAAVRDWQSERTRHLIEREAGRMRFADPADAWRLVDQSRIEFDTNGTPRNIGQLLGELAKTKPYLTGRPGNGSGEGGPRGGTAPAGFSMDDYIRNKAGRR